MTTAAVAHLLYRATLVGVVLLLLLGGACALHLVQEGPMPPSAKLFGQAWGAVLLITLCLSLAGTAFASKARASTLS